MSERRDIPDALRDAVERTVQATVGTRELAQGAASELSSSVDDLVKGAEKGITRSRRTVRAVVEERLPATQEDVKALRTELRRLAKRLEAVEERLADGSARAGARRASTASKPAAKSRSAASAKAPAKPASAKAAAKPAPAKPKRAAKTKSAAAKSRTATTKSKPAAAKPAAAKRKPASATKSKPAAAKRKPAGSAKPRSAARAGARGKPKR